MYDILDPHKRPKSVKELRERALRVLRHFPTGLDMSLAARGKRDVFKEPKNEPE